MDEMCYCWLSISFKSDFLLFFKSTRICVNFVDIPDRFIAKTLNTGLLLFPQKYVGMMRHSSSKGNVILFARWITLTWAVMVLDGLTHANVACQRSICHPRLHPNPFFSRLFNLSPEFEITSPGRIGHFRQPFSASKRPPSLYHALLWSGVCFDFPPASSSSSLKNSLPFSSSHCIGGLHATPFKL